MNRPKYQAKQTHLSHPVTKAHVKLHCWLVRRPHATTKGSGFHCRTWARTAWTRATHTMECLSSWKMLNVLKFDEICINLRNTVSVKEASENASQYLIPVLVNVSDLWTMKGASICRPLRLVGTFLSRPRISALNMSVCSFLCLSISGTCMSYKSSTADRTKTIKNIQLWSFCTHLLMSSVTARNGSGVGAAWGESPATCERLHGCTWNGFTVGQATAAGWISGGSWGCAHAWHRFANYRCFLAEKMHTNYDIN